MRKGAVCDLGLISEQMAIVKVSLRVSLILPPCIRIFVENNFGRDIMHTGRPILPSYTWDLGNPDKLSSSWASLRVRCSVLF